MTKPCRVIPTPYRCPGTCPTPFWTKRAITCIQRFGATLAYDTRNSTRLPNHGQRTELSPELNVGDTTFYKVELKPPGFSPVFSPAT